MSSVDKQIPGYVRFAIAGLSGGGASFVSHPLDLVKYRMQLSGKGGTQRLYKTSIGAVYKILKNEGIIGIYAGLSASILRQMTLTMTRMGMYSAIVDKFTAADGTPPSIFLQIVTGIVSGGVGAVVGNPADVALVRMSWDGANPPDQRYNYKHCFNAINRIIKEEGFTALYTGWKPAAYRCMVLNVTQIVLYKNSKVLLLKTGHFNDNINLHLLCTVWTALVSSLATAPIDITKTRIMAMKITNGKPEYTSMRDVWIKVIKHEGILALWKGVTPMYARLLPNSFVIFILLEFLTKSYKKLILGDSSDTGF